MQDFVLLDEHTVEQALGAYIPELEKKLPEKDVAFCRRVYGPPLERYVNRIRALGFTGLESVLDACAGFGQWSLVLEQLNKQVHACDINSVRLDVLDRISMTLGLNISTCTSPLDKMPYADESFEAIFCYSSFFCTPWRESLQEVRRVLKPGGRFYCNLNAIGYQLYLWVEEPNKLGSHTPRISVPRTFQNTLDYNTKRTPPEYGQIIIEPNEILQALSEEGMTLLSLEPEGHIDISGGKFPPTPFFPAHYMGQTCCYEILAEKKLPETSDEALRE